MIEAQMDVHLLSGRPGIATAVIIWLPDYGDFPTSGSEVAQAVLDHPGCAVDDAPPGAAVLAKVDGLWQAARVPLPRPAKRPRRATSKPPERVEPALSVKPTPLQCQSPRPAHRPRRDPDVVRVNLVVRVHPSTRASVVAEAKRTGESQGQVIDRLAALIAPPSSR